MSPRHLLLSLLTVVPLVISTGCSKTKPPVSSPTLPPADTIARVHWLGKTKLSTNSNAIGLFKVWDLPESVQLEQQTLDKLSLAPWLMLRRDADTNASALLRPIVEDILDKESYLEVSEQTNQSPEYAFAIRLNNERGSLWRTNLAVVLESLTGLHAVPATGGGSGWSLKKHDSPNLVELSRVGDWTIVGAAQDRNRLLAEFVARIQKSRAPISLPLTNDWFQADLDLHRITTLFAHNRYSFTNIPQLSLTLNGDGQYVLARGDLDFPQPPQIEMQTWTIPTNLIHEPLGSFTAIRGIGPLLGSLTAWKTLKVGEAPDQLYLWSDRGIPMQTYFAFPAISTSNEVQQIGNMLAKECNPWLATNAMGRFEFLSGVNRAAWKGVPFMKPQIGSVFTSGSDWILGGLLANPQAGDTMPDDLVQQVLGRTNLLFYDWEVTGLRMENLQQIVQLLRLVFGKPQMRTDSLGVAWLKAAAPNIGNSVTVLTETAPEQIQLVRGSRVGFTAIELHLLMDWLESPKFPLGLHTLRAPPQNAPLTNAPAQP